MKEISKFSVLMSLYVGENAKFLSKCLESIANQTVKPHEVVIVLDGPLNDELYDEIQNWKSSLNLIELPLDENKGLSFALNYGLSQCTNDLVARMDTDDICLPNRFETQLEFMKNNLFIDICGSFAIDISELGNEINVRKVPIEHDEIYKYIWSCPLIHPTVMFKKNKIISIGSYDIDAPLRTDDYNLWIRAAEGQLKFANISEPLIKYRVPDEPWKKNTLKVCFFQSLIGLKAVYKFDCRLKSFLAVLFPLFRSMLPEKKQALFTDFFKKHDPRD